LKRDQKFLDTHLIFIGLVAVFAIVIIIVAMKMSNPTQGGFEAGTEEYNAAVAQRLKPFGHVYLPGEELSAGEPQVPAAEEPAPVEAALSGPQVYNQSCNVCHGNGIGGAPMLSGAADWAARASQGADTLKDHAVNGYTGAVGFMPPKGGNAALSDAEIHAAVDFMLAEAGAR